MAKELKKKGRRLKRTVRKTLGTICLITAILIASIPTEGLKHVAADDVSGKSAAMTKSVLDENEIEKIAIEAGSKIPNLLDTATYGNLKIYNSGNGFQFAFVYENSSATDKIAIIVGFDYNTAAGTNTLEGSTLIIPESLDAYLNYTVTDGSYGSYCAVSQDEKFLFYESDPGKEAEVDASTGDIITPAVPASYEPCYYRDYAIWSKIADEDLYFYLTKDSYPGTSAEGSDPQPGITTPIQVRDAAKYSVDGNQLNINDKMRIKNAPIRYIGNHYATQDGDSFTIGGPTSETNRIFGNLGNITSMRVDAQLFGIGNYAFYGCTNLASITLNDDLYYIGNHAFEACRNMSAVNISSNARVAVIGAHAFESCQALATFNVPLTVQAIGDAAFRGCSGDGTGLRSINMTGPAGKNPSLSRLGCDLFVDCKLLTSVTFPGGITKDIDISNFEGCTSLQYIAVSSSSTKITQGYKTEGATTFGYKEFRQQYTDSEVVAGTFYFEGPTQQNNPSALHEIARKYSFAFSYLSGETLNKQGIYELTTNADGTITEDPDDKSDPNYGKEKATYRVSGPENSLGPNKLIGHMLDQGIEKISLPKYIGPQTISAISTGVFQDYCDVKQLIIPSTVRSIEANAFKGCHNLEYVLFEDPTGLQIADGAFKTQQIDTLNPNGTHKPSCSSIISDDDHKNPELTFVCPVSNASGPFVYAMKETNNINIGTQNPSYITVFSGWPDGLVVKYNFETKSNELLDYLSLSDLKNPGQSNMGKIYGALDEELAGDYTKAMTNALAGGGEGYDREAWNSFMNIVLPDGIQSIKAGLFKENESGIDAMLALPKNTYKTLRASGLKNIAGHDSSTVGDVTSGDINLPIEERMGGCFAGCTTFGSIILTDATETIGDYAFNGCENLTEVVLPSTVSKIGQIPFTGCKNLSHVSFQSNEFYTCDESIIYKLDTNGSKVEVVEYLEGRPNPNVNVAELTGVRSIAPEAFANTGVTSVDLTGAYLTVIPEHAFQDCVSLRSVYLPNSIYELKSEAFTGCPAMTAIELPTTNMRIESDAFDTSGVNRPDGLVFYCSEGSDPYIYATANGFKTALILPRFKVTFEDWDGKLLKDPPEYVEQGRAATPPADPVRNGYRFVGWNKDYSAIVADTTITALYEKIGDHDFDVEVTFYDEDFTTVLYTRMVTPGNKVDLPPDPKKDGYMFIGWEGSNSQGSVKVDDLITEKTNFKAIYEKLDGKIPVRFIDSYDNSVVNAYTLNPGDAPIVPGLPVREGVTYTKWFPDIPEKITAAQDFIALYVNGSGSGTGNGDDPSGNGGNGGNGGNSGNGSGSGDEDPTVTSKLYTLTVQNGSGSGSYVAGSQPIIIANNPASGQEFSHWTIDPAGTKIASTVLSATVITMPEGNVTVMAHYKVKTGTSSGSGSVSGNNSNRPTNGSNILSSGTTVVIDKNGLSNTGVVSATVKGSSDNFTIKITENSTASEAVVRALKAEYGDISNIKYFPMDISLYDSTGTKKITDTTGLSITITLPLPDSLATYAGNNQVAGVVNDRLDKLSPKFTTIDKVACVTFTAEHFSPYVIYVETDNLAKGQVVDSTPKTGDGIHPKWFLSIGLACVAMVLFMKKDKRALQKARVA